MKRFRQKKGREIGSFFDEKDCFASPVPSFNMEGSDQVGTSIGCFFSLIMTTCILGYGTYKGVICWNQMNPNIYSFYVENTYPKNYAIDLNEREFKIAFYVHSASAGREAKDDADLVEWTTQLLEVDAEGTE